MATIGSIIIGIRANTSDLKKNLGQAKNQINDFGSSLTSAKSLVLGLGAALAGSAFAVWVNSTAKEMDRFSEILDLTGSKGDKLSALAYAADLAAVDTETLASAVVKLNKNLAEDSDSKMGKSLSDIGLNIEELRSMDPADAFTEIAQGISTLPDQASKTAAAMQIFGKAAGANLVPLLSMGSAGIAELQEEARRLGITFDEVEAGKIGAAYDSLGRVQAIITGIGQDIAVELAPYITSITDQIVAFATEGDTMKNMVSGAFTFVTNSIIVAADAFDVLMSVFKLVQAGLTGAISYVIKGISMLVKAINYIPGVEIDTSTLDAVGDELYSLGQNQLTEVGSSDAGGASRKFFSDIESGANASATALDEAAKSQKKLNDAMAEGAEDGKKLVDKLREQVDTFGMSSTEAEIFKLSQEGVSSSILSEAKALQTQLDGLEANKKATEEALKAEEKRKEDLKSAAQSITDSVKTPAEKFAEEMAKLQNLKLEGLITDETFSRASDKLKNESGETDIQSNSVSAISLGSSEAFAAMDRLRGLNSGSDAVPKQQLGEQQKSNVLLAEISRRLGTRSESFALNTV